MFKELMARHCGAVLLGIKPAALFTVKKEVALGEDFVSIAIESGLTAEVVRSEADHLLLLVYDSGLLEQALEHPIARKTLFNMGYPCENGLEKTVDHLKTRFEGSGFPHEVGFFLGYPQVDVLGFIRFGGKRSKYSCMWKVYGNVDTAKRLCSSYEACSRLCRQHVENGGSLQSFQSIVYQAG